MAITNAQIIAYEAQRLLEAGKIKPTGRILTFETSDGETIKIPEAEPIHTFAMWKSLGYKVKKGEHAVTRLDIWKHTGRRNDDETDPDEAERGGYCFRKTACFFSASQVEPIPTTPEALKTA